MEPVKTRSYGKDRAVTFGDFIAGAYRAWGDRRAKGLVRLAFYARLVVFQEPQRSVIPEE
jgi:hypothetical protein